MKGTVLIVDDQPEYARFLNTLLLKFGYQTRYVHSAEEARVSMTQFCPDVVLMDKNLPDGDGIELVAELKNNDPNTQFIVITGHASVKSAVLSAKRGAVDYLSKPCEIEDVLLAVDNAIKKRKMTEEIELLRLNSACSIIPVAQRENRRTLTGAMKQTLSLAERAAQQKGPILLIGENGVGKERLARWIHNHSARSKGPFFSINLAALNCQKAEIELFGYEPGAYANTPGKKKGLLELGDSGTLLINEIESMDMPIQARLLTYLETKSILRLGGEELITPDTRIFVSSKTKLDKLVEDGKILEELYYRINVMPLRLPPLRERSGDIVPLAKEILENLATELGLPHTPTLNKNATEKLSGYHWPGNIRELRNVLERTLMLGHDQQIDASHLPLNPDNNSWHISVYFPENESLHDVTRSITRKLIEEALRRGGTKQQAAALLGLSRHALAHQMKALNLK